MFEPSKFHTVNKLLTVSLIALGAGLIAPSAAAQITDDDLECVIEEEVITCSGDLSDGIDIINPDNELPIEVLNIENVDGNVIGNGIPSGPGTGAFIDFRNGSNPITINITDPDIVITGQPQVRINLVDNFDQPTNQSNLIGIFAESADEVNITNQGTIDLDAALLVPVNEANPLIRSTGNVTGILVNLPTEIDNRTFGLSVEDVETIASARVVNTGTIRLTNIPENDFGGFNFDGIAVGSARISFENGVRTFVDNVDIINTGVIELENGRTGILTEDLNFGELNIVNDGSIRHLITSSRGFNRGIHVDNSDSFQTISVTNNGDITFCLLYTSPSPRDLSTSRMPSSA